MVCLEVKADKLQTATECIVSTTVSMRGLARDGNCAREICESPTRTCTELETAVYSDTAEIVLVTQCLVLDRSNACLAARQKISEPYRK